MPPSTEDVFTPYERPTQFQKRPAEEETGNIEEEEETKPLVKKENGMSGSPFLGRSILTGADGPGKALSTVADEFFSSIEPEERKPKVEDQRPSAVLEILVDELLGSIEPEEQKPSMKSEGTKRLSA